MAIKYVVIVLLKETITLNFALYMYFAGTAEGEGLVGPRPHHFSAPPPLLFALKRKIIKIKKRLETSFLSVYIPLYSLYFLLFQPPGLCGAPVLFAVIVPWGRLAP